MSAQAEYTPTATPDCCEVWPQIRNRFEWMKFEDWPNFLAMPHLRIGGTSWRVNHCPSCGAEVRDAIVERDNL